MHNFLLNSSSSILNSSIEVWILSVTILCRRRGFNVGPVSYDQQDRMHYVGAVPIEKLSWKFIEMLDVWRSCRF